MTHIVELINVYKHFDGQYPAAVNGLTLSIYRGEVMALLGPSGCGKTTTLRLIAGFERPDAGLVQVGQQVVAGPGRWVAPEKRGLGIVFQDYALFPHLTVSENVAFGLHRMARHERRPRVQELLALVGLTELCHRYPHELSGGQQQRVALARALAPRPLVVLLDEPFSNLDAELRVQMRSEVKRILHESGSTGVIVTHDQDEALSVGDRVGVMHAGRLEQVDTPERVFHQPATRFVADFLGLADFLPGHLTEHGVQTELGLIRQPIPGTPGRALDVMMRPHDVSLVVDPQGAGVVVGRQFHGSEYLYTVRLPSGQLVSSSQPHTVELSLGTQVGVIAEPGHHLVCFDGQHALACPEECQLPSLAAVHNARLLTHGS